MNAPLNPYASPQPAEPGGLDPNRLLTATFVVDERWQRQCAAQLTARQQFWMLPLLGGFMLTGSVVGLYYANWYSRNIFAEVPLAAFTGALTGMTVWLATLFLPLRTWNWYFGKSFLPLGTIRLTVSLERVNLETAAGEQDWYIRDVYCLLGGSKRATLRINPMDQTILVPATADFGADDYASWSKELARRLVTVAKKN